MLNQYSEENCLKTIKIKFILNLVLGILFIISSAFLKNILLLIAGIAISGFSSELLAIRELIKKLQAKIEGREIEEKDGEFNKQRAKHELISMLIIVIFVAVVVGIIYATGNLYEWLLIF